MQMTQCLLVCSSRLLSEETAAAGFLQVCLGLDRLSSMRASPRSQAFHVAVASTGHLPMGIPACLQSGQLMLPLPQKQQFQGLSCNDTCKKLVIPGTSFSARRLAWSGSIGLWRERAAHMQRNGSCVARRASMAGMGAWGWCLTVASPFRASSSKRMWEAHSSSKKDYRNDAGAGKHG